MANLVPPQYPTAHGFASPKLHAHPQFRAPLQQSSTNHKRQREDDEDENMGGAAMDRTPTPERGQAAGGAGGGTGRQVKGPPKRMRMEEKRAGAKEEETDVGVLLSRLPPAAHLSILLSLLNAQPALKQAILTLIPRPSLESALTALADASRKLKDAYPYDASASAAPSSSTGFGFGGAQVVAPPSRAGFGFGALKPQQQQQRPQSSGMRDEYVVMRLRPHVATFVSTALSFLAYFSQQQQQQQQQPAERHPSVHETFSFLSALTSHILAQPALAQSTLLAHVLGSAPQSQTQQPQQQQRAAPKPSYTLAQRLVAEWDAWIAKVDGVVNREGGMFSADAVRGWAGALDEYAAEHALSPRPSIFAGFGQPQPPQQQVSPETRAFKSGMRAARDRWVKSCGWLIGRSWVEPERESQMDEEL